MKLDVIVVNYHSPHDLYAFVESYYRHPFGGKSRLHVVNVESQQADRDVTVRLFEKYRDLSFVHYDTNIGYATAVNQESIYCTGDTYAFFNADTTITEGVLDQCVDTLWSEDSIAVVGPRQYDSIGRITHAGICGTLEEPYHRGWRQLDQGQYNDVCDVVSVSGSAYFVKRDAFNDLTNCTLFLDIAPDAQGAFLPTQHYYEESWCSYHAQAHGYRVVYDGTVGMLHEWHQASPVGGIAEQQWMKESQAYFRRACDHHGIQHD